MRWIVVVILCGSLLTLSAACGGQTEGEEAISTSGSPIGTRTTLRARAAMTAAATFEMTSTASPSATPEPSPTPSPTATPEPTATPTPIPEPTTYSGNDSDVIDIEKPDPSGPAIAYIRGNTTESRFTVDALGATGERLRRLVNTNESYEGVVLLDVRDGESTTRLEIRADGDWSIELRPIVMAREVSPGTEISGQGDDVLLAEGVLEIARIVGNADSRPFIVTAYGVRLSRVVNTNTPFDGRIIFPANTSMISVKADGPWTITFE